MSDAWAQECASTQDESPVLLKRSLPDADDADSMPRKRLAVALAPSSDAWSIEYDESLANTMLPPPLFDFPSTAEE